LKIKKKINITIFYMVKKNNKNIILIGFLFGLILFCSLRGCSSFPILEGVDNTLNKDSFLDTLGNVAKTAAATAGKVKKTATEVTNVFSEESKTEEEKKEEEKKKDKMKNNMCIKYK